MPSFPASPTTRVGAVLGALHFCAAALLCSHSAPAIPQLSPAGQTIVVRGNGDLGVPRLRQGFVHGIDYERGNDYSRTIALVSALKPLVWRFSSYGNVYGFVVGEARLPQTLGTQTVVVLQDLFNMRHGSDVGVRRVCLLRQKNCFSSYAAFKKSWMDVVNESLRTDAEKRLTIDYVDVFAEPDYGSGKLNVALEQLGDIFKATHDALRQYRPDVKIVAPSISSFSADHLKRLLRFVVENRLRLDAVSWHEFNAPETLPSHVGEIREFIRSQPRLCNPRCPEIHINEYASEDQQNPGYGVGWLYYLEKAGVDHASRACWDLPTGSTCWAGFNGMLAQDNVTPLPLYWAYKAYADMSNDRRVSTESSLPQTVAIAATNESRGELRILAGKYGQKGASGRVTMEVRDFRASAESVIAEVSRIPDGVQSLPAPPSPVTQSIPVQNDSFSIVIPEFRDGDAYSVTVRLRVPR
jgi:hypothetical protein